MEGPILESTVSHQFLSVRQLQLNSGPLPAISLSPSSLSSLTTLAITPRWMWRVANRLHELADLVEHIYLDMEELPTSEDPYAVTHIDPLSKSEMIPLEDTIVGCTDRMLNSGVPADKIVIGLNSGGRTFKVRDPTTTVHGDVAMQTGVRRSLQDVCQSSAFALDTRAASTVLASRTNWTSVNFPKEQSLGRKIQWITQEGLGGIGLSSLQLDDPKGKCGAGPYPSHTLIAKLLRCRVRDHHRLPSAQCTRLCYLDEGAEQFDPHALQPHWCSHIVVGPADIQFTDAVEITPEVQNLIVRVNKWIQELDGKRPKVILSIGARQTNDVWRMEVGNPIKKKNLISNIKTLVRAMNASGVEISWTLGALDAFVDSTLLSQFLTDLRTVLPKSVSIILTANPMSSFSGRYDVTVVKKTIDLVVLQTHRLHSAQQSVTGHHSAMFAGQSLLDNRMTVESFVKDWVSRGIPRDRLIVSVTAVPTTANLLLERTDSTQVFGLPTSPILTQPSQVTSQTKICKLLEDNSTKPQWLDDVGAPVLFRGTEFIAFDNEKSAKIKATWSSLNNLAGLAIHGLPFDNPEGECPDRPFPILQSIIDTQVCSLCAAESDSKCSPSFHTACNYRLPEYEEEQRLDPSNIPFERCTEIVVEHAIIDANATIQFPSEQQKEIAQQLKSLRSRTRGMILSMRCAMDRDEFAQMMLSAAKRLKLAGSIRSFIDPLAFNGVELRCAHLVSKATKMQFAHFLRLLSKEMKTNATGECGNTDSAIQNWEKAGLMRSKILLQVPAYGMEQLLLNSSDHGIGKPTEREYAIIGQAELCQRLKYAGTVRETHWDSMSVNAYTTGGRWISIDDQQTVKYKMRYALREGLAGVGLMSLNEDDHMGTCGSGAFPILRSIAAKCH
ncbi:glycosyl hydrolase, family 18 [Ancylostoma duodenale]|uniref:Glycosyl hydrolase, family 18 n=2 Tax=Ancylostoma duodenale TaxID=51022 RepID=A0A0C2DC44_9BILA|nr:glycosyl hydrolase, family 18 [Ancylostoma duodenale]